MAPEQIENRDVSAQTDVYALACVFFECLTGEVPFEGDSKVGVMFAHLQNERPSASVRKPGLPTDVDAVLARGMAKREEDRHASAGELAGEAGAALGLSGDFSTLASDRANDRRRLFLSVALAAIVIVAAAVAAAALLTGGGDEASVGDDWGRVAHVESVFGADQTHVQARSVASNGERFVAVGNDGLFDGESVNDGAAWWSEDGVTWTRSAGASLEGSEGLYIAGVAAGEDGFVAAGRAGLNDAAFGREGIFDIHAAIWTSPDGNEWTRVPHDPEIFGEPSPDPPFYNRSIQGVTRGGPGFVAVGYDTGSESAPYGAAVWTSADGAAWSRIPRDPEVFGSRFEGGGAATWDAFPVPPLAGDPTAPWESIDTGFNLAISTVHDIRVYLEALFTGELISDTSRAEMTTIGDDGRGMYVFAATLGASECHAVVTQLSRH